jgi:hypothetical protein
MLAQTDVTVIQMGKPSQPSTLQEDALQRAVIRVVASAERVGVTADEMIGLLKSGLTVGELLDYLAARTGDVA